MKRKIIGLMGEARTGKDTVADHLITNYYFQKLAFADSLKRACCEIFGFDREQLWGDKKEYEDPFWEMTPRYVLQYVGTDLFRKWIPDIWIRSLERHIMFNNDNVVVPDVRFKNEKAAIEKMGGEVWRLKRTDHPGAMGGIHGHASEQEMQSIPDSDFAVVIARPTGVEGLLKEIDMKLRERFFK